MPETTNSKLSYSRIARRIRVPLGFVFAVVYLWLARPTWTSLAIGALVAVPGLGLRALAAGHVKKNTELTTTGPYAYTRNPLYLGSVIIALGFGVASLNWWIAAGLLLLFFAIYLPVICSEEEYLRSAFPGFGNYAARVPRLFPRLAFTHTQKTETSPTQRVQFDGARYRRHREYNAVIGSALLLAALAAKIVFHIRL